MHEQIQAAIAELSPAEMQDLIQRVLALSDPLADMGERPAPQRRRPRRAETATYRIRVDLASTRPPLWRRLELASDVCLDQVHQVIQAAFGWTDSHLHQFGSGPARYGPETEHYLCPFQVEEGERGIPEEDVRLDEVLAEPGDKLFYDYDFGDGWAHLIKLEAVLPGSSARPRASCIAGRRDGPPEDCGGPWAYELISAAADPGHRGHAGAVAEFADTYGDDVEPGDMPTTAFDLSEINRVLAGLDLAADPVSGAGQPGPALPEPLNELASAIRVPAARRELRRLLAGARLDRPALADAATAARMVRPYAWLLDRVGADGITLTSAGHLPPRHVAAAMNELGLGGEWFGKGNRESQTLPILHLRQSALAMGLLRKRKGMLLLTAQARAVRGDATALWRYLAERMPPASRDQCETQAGLLLLIVIAAGAGTDPDAIIARLLGAIGWAGGDGEELDSFAAGQACWDTRTVLRRLGALAGDWQSEAPSAEGITFARAALQSWPSG